MELIESKTLGTAQASIEFTSIPSTFTDLVLLMSCRTDRSSAPSSVDGIGVNFNGVSTNLSTRSLGGSGSSAFSTSISTGEIGITTGSGSTANTFGNVMAYIPNYAGSTNKSWSSDDVNENNATDGYQLIRAGLWSNTAAITSIRLFPVAGSNFVAGSMISLYGVLKGSDGIVTTS
jgi:hypothetical protein